MSTPAETPSTPEPGFDPLAFWIEHKAKVQLLVVMAMAGLVGSAIYQYAAYRSRQSAANAFSAAKSPADWQRVVKEFAGSPVAANALLLLAESQRKEGKLDEALASLRQFTANHPSHPMVAGAWNSIAVVLELQGKSDEALNAYQKINATYPGSYAIPLALLGQARIHATKNQPDQARPLLEQVLSQFGQSRFSRQALDELQKLKPSVPEPAKDPAPVATPAPAPSTPAAANPAATPAAPSAPAVAPATPAAPESAPAEPKKP
jgi:predicted negative regulator of RcsB-dependent stress response